MADYGRTFYELNRNGLSFATIARQHNMTRNQVAGYVFRYRRDLEQPQAAPPLTLVRKSAQLPQIETYVYTGDVKHVAVPVYTGEWYFDEEETVITGDLHSVKTSLSFLERMVLFAKRHLKPNPTLYLVGDVADGDKDSKHAKHVPPIPRAMELDILQQTIDYLLTVFGRIRITPGNHLRNRLVELLEGDLSMNQLKRLFTNHPDRVEISPYDVVFITSGGHKWAATHQYQYSRSKLVTANKLAQKYQCNIITFHQHHTAIGRDEYNRYTIIDCGGMHQPDMMSYAKLVPNTMPNMNNGFVYLRNGVGNLLTPYDTMTSWDMWGFPPAQETATAANGERAA